MNGNNLLLDNNIVLYILLNGEETLISLLEEKKLFLSFITQLELLCAKYLEPDEISNIRQFYYQNRLKDIYFLSLKNI
jgi:predicted nucleic acid-binding protein